MWVNSQSCIFLVTGIVSILALRVGSSSALAFDGNGRRLLGTESRAGQFRLIHYTHPESLQYVPGLSLREKVNYGVLSGRERAAVLSSRMWEAGVAFETKPGSGSGDLSSNSSPSFNSSVHIIPGWREYSMEISIGTPPQKLSLLADTGSNLVWAQCLPCSNCSASKLAPSFEPANSSTYAKMSCSDPLCAQIKNACNPTCQFKYRYGNPHTPHPAGIMGDLSYETITLDVVGTGTTTTASGFAFGCGYPNLNTTFSQPPPIAGLGMGNLSFASQLGNLYGNKFSYCLVSPYDNFNNTSPLLFGDAAVPKVATQYTPILQNPYMQGNYFIGLKGIEVDGVSLDIPCGTFDFSSSASTRPGGVISDSGTSFTMLVTPAYTPLLKKMQSLIKYPVIDNGSIEGDTLNLCYNLSSVPSPNLPKVTMLFGGMNLDLPQDNVFVVIDDEMTTCLAFQESFGHFSIWGNTQQKNFQVLHDREAMQFGYAKVQCDKFG